MSIFEIIAKFFGKMGFEGKDFIVWAFEKTSIIKKRNDQTWDFINYFRKYGSDLKYTDFILENCVDEVNLNNKLNQVLSNIFSKKNIKELGYQLAISNGFQFDRLLKEYIKKGVSLYDIKPFDECYIYDFFRGLLIEYFKEHNVKIATQFQLNQIYQYTDDMRNEFRYLVDQNPIEQSENPLHYANTKIDFVGRNKEIKEIQEFLFDDRSILCTSVTGKGGTGKSKLLYYFTTNNRLHVGWKVVWFNLAELNKCIAFKDWYYPLNLLIVIDYATNKTEKLGEWIHELKRRNAVRPNKLRFIILDRHKNGENESENNNLNIPWYDDLIKGFENTYFSELEFSNPIELQAMTDDEYLQLIENYISKNHSEYNLQYDSSTILKSAKEIEGCDDVSNFVRPLVLLMSIEAYLESGDSKKFDYETIRKNIIEKEKNTTWEQLSKKYSSLAGKLEHIMAFATMIGTWNLENDIVLDGYPFANDLSQIFAYDNEQLSNIISVLNHNKNPQLVLKGMEPDLIGEYFVLNYINKQKVKIQKKMINYLWNNYSYEFSNFMSRAIDDYYTRGTFNILFKYTLIEFNTSCENCFALLNYAKFLNNFAEGYLKHNEKELLKEILNRLKSISDSYYSNSDIVMIYAKTLVYYARYCKNEREIFDTLSELERLSNGKYASDLLLAQCAKGFLHYIPIHLKNDENIMITVYQLKKLTEGSFTNNDVVLIYAKHLSNRCHFLKKEENKQFVISELKRVVRDSNGNPDVISAYSKSLSNEITYCSIHKISMDEITRELDELKATYPNDVSVNETYAKLLECKCQSEMDIAKLTEYTDELNNLLKKTQVNNQILNFYVNGLLILLYNQKRENKISILTRLEILFKTYYNSYTITGYAKGLSHYARTLHTAEERKSIVLKLENLAIDNNTNNTIVLQYVIGLAALTNYQNNYDEKNETVQKIKYWVNQFPTDGNITEQYAAGLEYLYFTQCSESEEKKTIQDLDELVQNSKELGLPFSRRISERYSKVLIDLAFRQKTIEERRNTSNILKTLAYGPHPSKFIIENYLISLIYISDILENEKDRICIANQILKITKNINDNDLGDRINAQQIISIMLVQKTEESRTKSLLKISSLLHGQYKKNMVTHQYLKGLLYLLVIQNDINDKLCTISNIKEVYEVMNESGDRRITYISSLVFLTLDLDLENAYKKLSTELNNPIKDESNKYNDLVYLYASGLSYLLPFTEGEIFDKIKDKLLLIVKNYQYNPKIRRLWEITINTTKII